MNRNFCWASYPFFPCPSRSCRNTEACIAAANVAVRVSTGALLPSWPTLLRDGPRRGRVHGALARAVPRRAPSPPCILGSSTPTVRVGRTPCAQPLARARRRAWRPLPHGRRLLCRARQSTAHCRGAAAAQCMRVDCKSCPPHREDALGGRGGEGSDGREAAERRSGRAGECGPQRQLRLAPAGSTTSAFLAPPRSRGTSGRGTAPGRPRTRARPAAPWIGSPPPRPPPPRAGGPGEAKRTRSMPLYVGRALQADVGRFFK
ncbi:unnamed protein product [Prorocentrum cordatum]|uniref:Uncharacterized protein n=1 Tax=Prorocentrum cordatum TaxID=2364126 RepID=A0ABN9UFK6_9DINO|nr:unnamed protein product [Polarella glacialis]